MFRIKICIGATKCQIHPCGVLWKIPMLLYMCSSSYLGFTLIHWTWFRRAEKPLPTTTCKSQLWTSRTMQVAWVIFNYKASNGFKCVGCFFAHGHQSSTPFLFGLQNGYANIHHHGTVNPQPPDTTSKGLWWLMNLFNSCGKPNAINHPQVMVAERNASRPW